MLPGVRLAEARQHVPLLLALIVLSACAGTSAAPARQIRVCADPNNLPFSNSRLEGFENRLAELVAHELGAKLHYTWWAQRRGFFRNTLNAGRCDLVTGAPASFELALVTRPYYRSTYVFVHRRDRRLRIASLDDPVLRRLRIGVHLVGDDGANTPPAHALAARGLARNVAGYSLYGDYAEPHPPSRVIRDVARGTIDLAIVWGPMAAYFARQETTPLVVAPVSPQIDLPFLPFVYDIGMAVRRGDDTLKNEVEAVLERRRDAVGRILADYGVPRL